LRDGSQNNTHANDSPELSHTTGQAQANDPAENGDSNPPVSGD